MAILETSAFGQDMMVASYVAFLSAVAWMIVTQISTNRSFRQAINEFRVTIEVMDNRYRMQQNTCEQHRMKTEQISEKVQEIMIDQASANQSTLTHPKIKKASTTK